MPRIHVHSRVGIDILSKIRENETRRIFIICEDGTFKSQILSGLIRCSIPNLRVQVISSSSLPTKFGTMRTELRYQKEFSRIMNCEMTTPLNNVLADMCSLGVDENHHISSERVWSNFFDSYNSDKNMFILLSTGKKVNNYVLHKTRKALSITCDLPNNCDNMSMGSMKNIIASIFLSHNFSIN